MITAKNIRKIPKYMLHKIQQLDRKENSQPNGHNRFYKYYTLYNRELCEVIVAVRHYRKSGIANKSQCMVFTRTKFGYKTLAGLEVSM